MANLIPYLQGVLLLLAGGLGGLAIKLPHVYLGLYLKVVAVSTSIFVVLFAWIAGVNWAWTSTKELINNAPSMNSGESIIHQGVLPLIGLTLTYAAGMVYLFVLAYIARQAAGKPHRDID
jgi:ABC-type dipeptide/oligopeptide/nickel transport system permease component